MKNFKNMFIAIVSIVGFLSIQSSKAEFSYNERRFVEDTKNKKFTMMEKGGIIREEWLSYAIDMISDGKVSDSNKDYVLKKLSEMIDILVGASLRSKENVSDAQYAKIMYDVDSQVRLFVYDLAKKNQQLMAAVAPKRVSVMESDLGLSDNAVKLLNATKNKQLGVLFIERGSVTDEWLMKAVSYIVNGRLTIANKQRTTDQIIQVIDVLYGAPLRSNSNITDAQYDQLTARVQDRVINFMDKLYVGAMYII